MSGICGIIMLDGSPVSREDVRRMAERARHRGPNGIRYHCRGMVGIACLSLDPTEDRTGSSRPIVLENSGFIFAADARFDARLNRTELECVADLARCRRHTDAVRTSMSEPTDQERMLAVVLETGGSASPRLLGDFAYALWSHGQRELRLARDPMGVRSLYYRIESNRLVFATEVSQILALGGVPRRLNEHAVAWYLSGMQVPPSCVFYEGIEAVEPGQEVIVAVFDGRARVHTQWFWQPDPCERIRYRDERDYAIHLRELLAEAMCSRLRSRTSAGVSLSGGVDSTTVASVTHWLRESGYHVPPLRAYSWTFDELPECDERENIYRVADHCGIPVREIRAEETRPVVDHSQDRVHEDDPFSSMFEPTIDRIVRAAVEDGVRTMCYGSRGDVICGGNVNDVPGVLLAQGFAETRRELAALARAFEISSPQTVSRYLLKPFVSDMLSFLRVMPIMRAHSRSSRNAGARRVGPMARVAQHVRTDFLERAGLPNRDPAPHGCDQWNSAAQRQRCRHVFSPLVMRGVSYTERLNAGYGVEFADPWSDRRIVEFIFSIPQHVVDRASDVKRLSRRALEGIIPDRAIAAMRKVSPEPMYVRTLRGAAHATIRELLTDGRCEQLGIIDGPALRNRFERFSEGKEGVFDIWSTLSLEMWLRRHWT